MRTATEAFLSPLEEWIQAIRAEDFATAKHKAEFVGTAGQLLAIHPDFIRTFKRRDAADPEEALFHLSQFLVSATEGRATALGGA